MGSEFRTAVILGSGLGAAGRIALENGGLPVSYDEIPGMPQPSVAGHAGRLVLGRGALAGVLLLQGRIHYYEGHSLAQMLFAVRMLHDLGIQQLIVTNAAGGINSAYAPGDLMLIEGHWTFLKVTEDSPHNGRSPAADKLWNEPLRRTALSIATRLKVHEGVYAMMSGPNYETPAEVRMLQTFGVDAVGMSTVPEALAAAQRGISVLGISCITNVASGLGSQPLDHSEVGETASGIEEDFTNWLFGLLQCVT